MKNAMTYKGYAARIEFDAQDRIFFGRLAGIRDIITFHGETVDELENKWVADILDQATHAH
jgi:predicted HicB family RNase H-like nuclease